LIWYRELACNLVQIWMVASYYAASDPLNLVPYSHETLCHRVVDPMNQPHTFTSDRVRFPMLDTEVSELS
jgi:hypothetical protein